METIYDPVYQWNYNGTAEGAVRNDKKYCGRFSISAVDAKDKSGAWLNGERGKKVEKVSDGCLTIALHGRFPSKADKVAIASLGSAKVGENGKALLLTTGGRGALAAHVIAKVPGQGFTVVSTTPIPLPVSRFPFPIPRFPFPIPRFPFGHSHGEGRRRGGGDRGRQACGEDRHEIEMRGLHVPGDVLPRRNMLRLRRLRLFQAERRGERSSG